MEGLRAGLRARGIRKAYAGVPVLSNVDFDLAPGEIHALVGENGAGKSTFLKIIGGAVSPDEGQLMLEDAIVTYHHPDVARRLGVSVVYQEFTLVPDLSVVDNIFLGRERSSASGSRTARRRRASAVLEMLGASVPPDALVRGLSVAHQQLVEIARALVTEAKVLILDEPSASLSLHDVTRLFAVLRDLVRRGLGIIYVSHRLDEVFEIADRITVLRDGRWISTTQRVWLRPFACAASIARTDAKAA